MRQQTICVSRIRSRAFSQRLIALVGLSVALIALPSSPIVAQQKYDPEHPEVQELINSALNFLMEGNRSSRVGNRVMLGLAAYKAQVISSPKPKEHPLIEAAIQAIIDECTPTKLEGSATFEKTYASALACVFLLELDSDKYSDQINTLLDHIAQRQQASGAWGYRSEKPQTGDTSQMQYIALALWLANEKGFAVNYNACRDALDWMVETQQNDGGWWYKSPPDLVARNFELSRTSRPPLVAAGLGTVYLYADLLRLMSRSGTMGPKSSEDPDLPPDVVDVTDEDDPESYSGDTGPRVRYDRGKMVRSMNSGNRWFAQNFSPETEHYNMYFLYGYERYAALREYVEGENKGVEDWYDQGVEFMKEIQGPDGRLVKGDTGEIAAKIQTAFGILFLTRSMSITLGDKANNTLSGGFGFKNDVILKQKGEKIVGGAVDSSVTDLLELMKNPDADQLELFLMSLEGMKLDGDEVSRNEQLSTLRGLVTHEDYRARMIAVKFLSKQRALVNVPAFIFALTDPDPEVVIAAHEALRFVSRKTEVRPLKKGYSTSDLNRHRKMWKEWFKKVKPDGVLLQEPEE